MRPTFLRFVVLALATILTIGGGRLSLTLGAWPRPSLQLPPRLLQTPLVLLPLAQRLAGWVFHHLVPEGRIHLVGDDTVDEHPGDKVFGKGCHRDPVRSTHSFTAFRWGSGQVGGAGRAGSLPLHVRLAVGLAPARGPVSQRDVCRVPA